MRDMLFSAEFHLTVFAILSLVVAFFLITTKILEASKKLESLKSLKNKEKWEEIPIKIESKGYFVHYPYPHTYSRQYENLSELQEIKASSYEFENYKLRIKKEKIENDSGKVTMLYRDSDGKLRSKISFSNNQDVNYRILMRKKDINKGFRFIQKPSLVVLSIPDEYELKVEAKKALMNVSKKSFTYLIVSTILCIASLSF